MNNANISTTATTPSPSGTTVAQRENEERQDVRQQEVLYATPQIQTNANPTKSAHVHPDYVNTALVTDNNTTTTKRCEQSSSTSRTGSSFINSSNPILPSSGNDNVSIDSSTTSSSILPISPVQQGDSTENILVPKFRVEGSGAGDSSVTVGVTSVSLNSTAPQDCCSGSGPSSEDMKLSLVSWYSEPDNALITSTSSCCEGEARQTMSLTGSLLIKSGSEEKENQTPEPNRLIIENDDGSCSSNLLAVDPELMGSRESVLTLREEAKNSSSSPSNNCNGDQTTPIKKLQIRLLEVENGFNSNSVPNFDTKKQATFGHFSVGSSGGKPECAKCTRRSKSGNNTPASHSTHQCRARTMASRRLMPSTKSSTEVKKPIKSILKSDSNSRSGSGSDNKSSMDSLGSAAEHGTCNNSATPLRPRSESSNRAKFNLNHQIFNEHAASNLIATTTVAYHSSEERISTKLRRIEKYATLRLRQARIKPLDTGSVSNINNSDTGGNGSKGSTPTPDLMTKSMSFLEKGDGRRDPSSLPCTAGNKHNSNSLKRQGSLRTKKGSPQWEPCTTRTTALRMQKMQEAKVKSGGIGVAYSTGVGGSGRTGSTHSGSGESIHHLATSTQNHAAISNKSPASATPSTKGVGEKHKVFAKLSSAFGQTASSNQKRLKQEKSVQTDLPPIQNSTVKPSQASYTNGNLGSISPIPSADATTDLLEQIRQLEKLANRYRNTALRFQSEYEHAEAKKSELAKQLQETQTESNEMAEFLQAEKSTLAESLTEIEIEAKKWRDQIQAIKKESDSRISTLVRLGEQHKQEALKSQALVKRLESQSNTVLTAISNQISEGTHSIVMTRRKITSLTECLIKEYKVPEELLTSFANADIQTNGLDTAQTDKTQPNSSLLLPLITSLAKAFPTSTYSLAKTDGNEYQLKPKHPSIQIPSSTSNNQTNGSNDDSATLDGDSIDAIGIDQITLPQLISSFPEDDDAYLTREVVELNAAVGRLLLVVRVIVVQCDKQVSNVASSILQCLQSEGSSIPPITQVQKSHASHHNGNANTSTTPCQIDRENTTA